MIPVLHAPSWWSSVQQAIHRPIVASLLAFFIYGLWAAGANMDHGYTVAWRAGVGQGVYAFIATLLVGSLAIKVYKKFHCTTAAMLLAFTLSFILMLVIPLTVHTYLQTPDKWQAMSLGLLWGTGYLVWVLSVARRVVISERHVSAG